MTQQTTVHKPTWSASFFQTFYIEIFMDSLKSQYKDKLYIFHPDYPSGNSLDNAVK